MGNSQEMKGIKEIMIIRPDRRLHESELAACEVQRVGGMWVLDEKFL